MQIVDHFSDELWPLNNLLTLKFDAYINYFALLFRKHSLKSLVNNSIALEK